MSENLQKLIEKAQLQKLQIESNLLYAKNMKLFQARFPDIFKLFENHKPEKFTLGVDPEYNLNLIDTDAKHYVYSSSPQKQAEHQVARFERKLQVRKFTVPTTPIYNPDHIHIPTINNMINEYEKNAFDRLTHTPEYLLNLMVSGVGMGYQLPILIEKFNIQNIFVFEHCKDTFHACLHVIDWTPILDYFAKQGRAISLCIGVDPRKALSQIEFVIRNLGLHSQIFTFLFQHSQRKQELDFISIFQTEIRSFVGGLGYFDDEQIGIGHAYHNLMSNHSVFRMRRLENREERLVVVGNGPSLDHHLNYLKSNTDKLIILSCGSALGSLYRANIKPDFHVEMERDYAMTDYIVHDTPKEFRQDITLLCLHSVAPETLNQFGKSCYAIKIHDAGAPLIHDYFKPESLVELAFCNPTVSNCAMAFAVYMGFNNIHLIGTDFGVTDDGKHHSKNSLHYKMQAFVDDDSEFDYDYKESNDKRVEANFGGMVKTHHILDTSRVAIERLLDFSLKKSSSFRCYNSNNGAKIRNATPIRLEDMPPLAKINKKCIIEDLEKDYFYTSQNKRFESLSTDTILKKFYDIQSDLKIKANIDSDQALVSELNRIFQKTSIDYDPMTHFLLRGSISCFFGSIVQNSLYTKSTKDFESQVSIGRAHFNKFIDLIYERARSEPFKVDDFRLELLHKMSASVESES